MGRYLRTGYANPNEAIFQFQLGQNTVVLLVCGAFAGSAYLIMGNPLSLRQLLMAIVALVFILVIQVGYLVLWQDTNP
jgi:hypothetical protein